MSDPKYAYPYPAQGYYQGGPYQGQGGPYQGPPVMAPPQYAAPPPPRAQPSFLEGCLAALCCCCLIDECCCDPSIIFVGLVKTDETVDSQVQRPYAPFVHYRVTVYIFIGTRMEDLLGDVSLLVSLDESPLTSSWNASTFTGGTRMPYEFLQHSANQGIEADDGGIKPAKNPGILTSTAALV
ncbi:hypothetical protein D1007_29916 [Hordeum vulgare]|nr:hypothetical protein D1007_29916 [Hordeum vulgare]